MMMQSLALLSAIQCQKRYEGKSLGLKSLVEFPMELEKFFGAPVDVIRKHNNLRPSFLKRIQQDIIYV